MKSAPSIYVIANKVVRFHSRAAFIESRSCEGLFLFLFIQFFRSTFLKKHYTSDLPFLSFSLVPTLSENFLAGNDAEIRSEGGGRQER